MPEEEPGEGQALRVGKQFTPEERKAISIANKKSLETFQRFPEAKRLEIQKDRQGNPKFKKMLDENENPVLGANGKPNMEVAFSKAPYKLVKSPKLSKKEPRAVVQAADLLETDARKAFNNPSISKGIGWYSTMRNFLQNQFGANIEVFGQLLGATSARTPVDTNFKQALEAIKLLSTGQYDGLLADFSKHVEKTYTDSKSGELLKQWQEKNPDKKLSAFKTDDQIRKQINQFKGVPLRSNGRKYNANSQKVLHVLHGIWLQQTVGPKTPNFAGNLTGRTLKATIDVWAARNLRRLLYEGSLEKWRILPEQESGVTNKDFFFAQKVYEDVGKRLGMNADDLQALMWFMEKDVWEKNGWTSTVGAEKSSFDKEAGKLALDRYQAGVTTFTSADKYSPEVQEQERLALRKSISNIPGITSSRVNHSDGLYGNTPEPSLDVEFVVQRNKDGSSQDISAQVSEILRIASEQGRKQMDVFVSKVVDENHPNARPMVEIGFKKPASKKDVKAVVEAFRSNGIDGFTMAKDGRGNVIGIRSQYIPEISARFDTVEHIDQAKFLDFADKWITNVEKSLSAVEQIDNVSYKTPGWVSTTVYGIEEYSTAKAKDNGRTSLSEELVRRKTVLDSGQVSDGSSPVEGMDPGAGGLPAPAGDVQPAGSQSSEGVSGEQRYMPASDMASGRSVKDHGEAVDLFEKGYRIYGAPYDGMEDPIRLKKVTEIDNYDPENLWAVPSKKIAAAIGIRNMPASDTDYLSAVKAGDTATAQRMVDEAAKAAGYTVGPLFHGTRADFNKFQRGDLGIHLGTQEQASNRGSTRQIRAFLKANPLRIDDDPGFWMGRRLIDLLSEKGIDKSALIKISNKAANEGGVSGEPNSSADILARGLMDLGIDSIQYPNKFEGAGDSIVVLDPSQIKSADPITKDDAGNVIPLSQRFKATSEDIRYMPGEATIYRAGDKTETGVKAFSSWSENKSTAEAYLDNPGFGGAVLRSEKVPLNSVLDADTTNRKGMERLASQLGFDAGTGDEWFDNGWKYPWEESKSVKEALKKSGFDAIRYPDDFPEGATSIVPLKDFAGSENNRFMPSPDSAMPGAYSFPGGYRALPGKAKGSLRLYGPAGSLIGIASSLDEAQRILRRKGNR
jgi:hypothetical protein